MASIVNTLFFLWITMSNCTQKMQIPQHLAECYRWPRPPLLPMNVETMTEIIRKIRFSYYTPISLSQEVSDIINWFLVEGIERSPNAMSMQNVIPYHRTGFQALRQDLLFEKLIPIQRRPFEAYSLSTLEKCTLHNMVSSSVDYWERGDEPKTCPKSPQEFRNMTADGSGGAGMYSVCPTEEGVVQTSGGSISMGRLLTTLLAALTPQNIPLSQLATQEQLFNLRLLPTDTVSNVWASSIAGDLAEVALEQSPLYEKDVKIGVAGRWNNTDIPSTFYFDNVPFTVIEKQQWQLTDAEILGGIDGILLGDFIQKMDRPMLQTFRLSQLLEIYYSNWSVGQCHVCNRRHNFNTFMRGHTKTLIEQTKRFAALLSTKTTTYFTVSSVMDYRCINAIEKFNIYYPHLLEYESCSDERKTIPRLNLFVILDATWSPYLSLCFVMLLAKTFDISYYGGSIAIINGDSSMSKVNSTSNPSILYQKMRFSKENDPKDLKLHISLNGFKKTMEEENIKEHNLPYPRQAHQNVLIVMGYSSTIADKDLKDSVDILKSIKSQNPAVQFVYVASPVNSERFKLLMDVGGEASSDTVISTDTAQHSSIISLLQPKLKTERLLKPAYCKSKLHEWPEEWYNEYVTPGQTNAYWIHPKYFFRSLDIVKITFKTYQYGELRVCMSRGAQRGDCKVVARDTEVTHAVLRPCDTSVTGSCQPLYFTVNVLRTYDNCAEYECRYPNQVKFSIIVQDLHCINLNTDVCSKASIILQPSTYLFNLGIYFILLSGIIK